MIIFFNKSDLDIEEHEIKDKDIEEIMRNITDMLSQDVKYFIGSAKSRDNMEDTIYEIIHQIDQKLT